MKRIIIAVEVSDSTDIFTVHETLAEQVFNDDPSLTVFENHQAYMKDQAAPDTAPFVDFYRAVAAVEPPEETQLAEVLNAYQDDYDRINKGN